MKEDPLNVVHWTEDYYAEYTRYEPNSYDGFSEPCEVAYGEIENREGELHEFRVILRIRHEPFGTDRDGQYVAECVAYTWDSERERSGAELYHFTTADHRITWKELLESVVDEAHMMFPRDR